MEVTIQLYFPALEGFPQHLLDCVALREKFEARRWILAVKIMGAQRAAIVADDHSIRVEHWHNLENKSLSQ
jgi:hypothetical protein